MTTSIINRIIQLFTHAFSSLGVQVPMAQIERLAMTVHHGMEYGQRVYHTSPHVLDICRDMKPHQVLAGLFHDIVYYQLDGGLPPHAELMLKRAVHVTPQSLKLRRIDREDHELAACAHIFGFSEDQELPLYGGLNEFLSALVAVRLLSPYLPPADLLPIIACIEQTVPFRGHPPGGTSSSETLAERLRQAAAHWHLALADSAVDRMVRDAVILANRDVSGFAVDDPSLFLSATWLLIEESNAPLSVVGVYSIQDYRKALQRMEGFLASLNPENIFHHYQGYPDAEALAGLTERSRINLAFSVDYLGAKLASIAVVEALALATGGDAPVSMLLGDIADCEGKRPDRIEDFLSFLPPGPDVDLHLLAVLEKGRSRSSSSDLTASPLTAYLYRALGHDGLVSLGREARRMFGGELTPVEFLQRLPVEPVRAITEGCTRIALSRAHALQALRSTL
jgi:hypothetical protein